MTSTFIIKDQKLFLKTYNRELTVESELSSERLWQLAADLTNLALMHKKIALSKYNYIWCNVSERKVLFLLRQGHTKTKIAEICHRSTRQIYNIIAKIKNKIANLDPTQAPTPPKNTVLYQKVIVTTIPFSSLVTDEFDDGEEVEFGDGGKGAAEIIGRVEDRLDDSPTFQLFADSPRAQELMTLLEQGFSRRECATKMGVSLQEIHQKVGRIKERLKKHGQAI